MDIKFYTLIFSIVLFVLLSVFTFSKFEKESIKVGIIHSLSGTMAMSEKSVLDATLLSIDEINKAGGILGKKLEAVVVDGKSNDEGFKDALNQLIKQNITTIFGGWTSSSRKAMKPILEKNDALLFYPIQYEGFENSKNIVYLGLTPNQQVVPTIDYAVKNFGNRAFLVGSEYIYPKMTNKFIESISGYMGISIVAEEYKILGERDFTNIIEKIKVTKPSFILNTLNGDSNTAFFKALKEAGISLHETPVFSFSITETEMQKIAQEIGSMEGNYITWSYFNSLDTPQNKELKKLFNTAFAKQTTITEPMYTAFMGVQLFAKIATKYNCYKTSTLKKNIGKQSIGGAGEILTIEETNNHIWKQVLIAKIDAKGEAQIVWDSKTQQEPKPFPLYIDSDTMLQYQDELYKKWGNKYEASKELK
ncbi:MAG: urea ABC transporter substrate-binding protein [Campylobacterales bacterium]|nr:urea ABC transporter substrate-binding protein [Campylobacterales bacterium]